MIFSEGEDLLQHHLANWKKPTERPYDCSCAFCRLKRESNELKVKSETIAEWFERETKALDKDYTEKRIAIQAKLAEKQEGCIHEFERQEEVFWVPDVYAPGMVCKKCGFSRDLNEDEK